MAKDRKAPKAETAAKSQRDAARLQPMLQIVIQCRDEDEQRDLYEEMTGRGYRCRVLSI